MKYDFHYNDLDTTQNLLKGVAIDTLCLPNFTHIDEEMGIEADIHWRRPVKYECHRAHLRYTHACLASISKQRLYRRAWRCAVGLVADARSMTKGRWTWSLHTALLFYVVQEAKEEGTYPALSGQHTDLIRHSFMILWETEPCNCPLYWDSLSGECEDYSVLECDAYSFGGTRLHLQVRILRPWK